MNFVNRGRMAQWGTFLCSTMYVIVYIYIYINIFFLLTLRDCL